MTLVLLAYYTTLIRSKMKYSFRPNLILYVLLFHVAKCLSNFKLTIKYSPNALSFKKKVHWKSAFLFNVNKVMGILGNSKLLKVIMLSP